MKEIKGFKTFCRFVLPLVYSDELSYYEQMCKVSQKLNEVIEQINLNSEQVENLTNFVNNYFKNLDVQTEVNNKLDEMASDGTLAEIINSQFYNSIHSAYNKRGTCIIMADSYGFGTASGGIQTSWTSKLQSLLNPFYDDIVVSNTSGAGMSTSLDSGLQFANILSNINPPRGKSDVSLIICCGGINDAWGIDFNKTNTGVRNFSDVVYNQFPNAIALIGCVSFSSDVAVWSNWMLAVQCWKTARNYASTFYIPDSEYILKNVEYISEDKTHPTLNGQNQISNFLFWTLRSGYPYKLCDMNEMSITLTANDGVIINTSLSVNVHNNLITFESTGVGITFNSPTPVKTDFVSFAPVIGKWTSPVFLPINKNNFVLKSFGYYVEGGVHKPCVLGLYFNPNGNLAICVLGSDCESHNITQIIASPIKETFDVNAY